MKNFLIVLGVLFGCFALAFILVFTDLLGGQGGPGGLSLEVAEWRNYDDPQLKNLEVVIFPNQIVVQVPATPVFKQIIEKGRWNMDSFLCNSHLDTPAEVEVAKQLKNEDLEFDVGRFLPDHPGKIVCVKVMRGMKDLNPGYPTRVPGQTVAYPPPKGLIRIGMLECDLQSLPWQADKIELAPKIVTVDVTTLSDGQKNKNYFTPYDSNGEDSSSVYSYHSDRTDAPKLLVTVDHGRVIQVAGGAEETTDIPYPLPSPPSPTSAKPEDDKVTWVGWLFNLFFTK